MDVVNVRQLKNNPSEALRNAAKGPVLVMKGDSPTAWIVGLGNGNAPDELELRLALAASLFRDRVLSLGRAARLADVGVGQMITHLSRLRLTIGDDDQDVEADIETLEKWFPSS